MSAPPYSELTTKEAVRQAVIWQLIGLAILVAHVFITKAAIVLYPVGLIALAVVYEKAPLSGLLLYFQMLLYQGIAVAMFAPGMERFTFTALLGTNFLALVIIAGLAFMRIAFSPTWRAQYGALLTAVKVALVVGVIYTGYGAAREGVTSAAIYLREAESLVLMVLVGLDVGRIWGYRTVGIGFLTSAVLSVAISITEVVVPVPYYATVHAAEFQNLKLYESFFNKGGSGPAYSAKQVEEDQEPVFFNITGDTEKARSYRFMGTIMHAISDAYILADVAIVALMVGAWQFCIPILPMLLLSGVKGANILFYATWALYFCIWRFTRSRGMLIGCGAVLILAYVGLGIVIGVARGDFHAIGFMGGVHGFISNPIGHGIGAGGNFSPQAAEGVDWQQLQHTDNANFALESAVGVLLYQMGIASLSIFAIIWLLVRHSPIKPRSPRLQDLAFIALVVVMANGFFQEEAYTPYGAGMFALLCALIVANGSRDFAVLLPRQARGMLPVFVQSTAREEPATGD